MSATAGPSGQIRIRGTREGIGVSLPEHLDSAALLDEVRATIDARRDFFQGANVILDYATRRPSQSEVSAIEAMLAEAGIGLDSISVARPEHGAMLREMGYQQIHVVAPSSQRERDFRHPMAAQRSHEHQHQPQALYLKRTLRSGASIKHNGDVVIIGDVNPGAHVSAGGDVIVWGALRGTVQAGSDGDENAIICALRLEPTQLRISSRVARPPDGSGWAVDGPQSAFISAEDNQIVVEPWRGGGAGSTTERRGR